LLLGAINFTLLDMRHAPADLHRQEERLRQDIHRLAGEIGERNVYSYSKLCEAAAFVEQSFRDAGYRSARQEYDARGKIFANIEVESVGHDFPDEIVIIGAHYDTARGSPGANDNGSGIAALFALARWFGQERVSRTLRFVAFTNEERPFLRTARMGSRIYARRCRRHNENITAMISLETIGYCSSEKGSQWLSFFGSLYPNRGDFILFASNPSSKQLLNRATDSFRRKTNIPCETATLPSFSPGAKSSDQWSFWKESYPGLMVTDTAPLRYPYYHKAEDTPDKVHYEFLNGVVEGLKQTVSDLVICVAKNFA
jgi:Zn-dependent M28 family amino/carboxypeptidase